MLPTTYLATAVTLVTMAAAIPLNINLGAYSPALVVGDGAIEFRGEERPRNEAAAVVNALQAPSTGAAVQEAAVAAPVAKAATLPLSEPATIAFGGIGRGKQVETQVQKRDLAGFDLALKYAEVGLKGGPRISMGTGENVGVGILVENSRSGTAAA